MLYIAVRQAFPLAPHSLKCSTPSISCLCQTSSGCLRPCLAVGSILQHSDLLPSVPRSASTHRESRLSSTAGHTPTGANTTHTTPHENSWREITLRCWAKASSGRNFPLFGRSAKCYLLVTMVSHWHLSESGILLSLISLGCLRAVLQPSP